MESLKQVYRRKGYFASHAADVVISFALIVACLAYVGTASVGDVLATARTDWATNRCNPIYMPFAGAIMPSPGQSAFATTASNFDFCTQQDVSAVLKTALMPLEFVSFAIAGSVELLVNAVMLAMKLLNELRLRLGGIFKQIFEILARVLVPITVFFIRMHDNLAKMNAVTVTTLFTALVIYKITVAGTITIMTIIMNLMLVLIGVIVGMLVLAFILLPNPFTIFFGLAVMVAATLLCLAILIPALVLYAKLHIFITRTFQRSTAAPPGSPI